MRLFTFEKKDKFVRTSVSEGSASSAPATCPPPPSTHKYLFTWCVWVCMWVCTGQPPFGRCRVKINALNLWKIKWKTTRGRKLRNSQTDFLFKSQQKFLSNLNAVFVLRECWKFNEWNWVDWLTGYPVN